MMKVFVPLVAMTLSSFSFAQNPLSVHVLNLENGLPSAGVKVILEKQENNQWKVLNNNITNQQGRITDLYPKTHHFKKGFIKLRSKQENGLNSTNRFHFSQKYQSFSL